MSYKLEIKKGVKIEREHKPTLKYMEKYRKEHGKCPPENKVYEHIAKDHIKEDKNYYKKLAKANL